MPTIRIHVWGGLGSQLFAVALAQDIHEKFPKRRIRMILHTGGVTRRAPEVASLFPQWTYEFVEDFKETKNSDSRYISSRNLGLATRGRVLIKKLIFGIGIAASCDSDHDFEQIKPWLLFCRGHYSYRTVTSNFLSTLNHIIHENLPPLELANACAIHYRLGDLLELKEKGPISNKRLVSEFLNVSKVHKFDVLVIFSDSPSEARINFQQVPSTYIITPNVATVQVMAYSTDAKFFIGTSSKISFWISGIRAQVRQKPSLLPFNNSAQFRGLAGSNINLISTYSISE